MLQVFAQPHFGRHLSFATKRETGQQGFLGAQQVVFASQQGAGFASQHSGAGFASQHLGAGLQQRVRSCSLGRAQQVLTTGVQRALTRHNNCASALFAPKERAIASMTANVAPPTANDRFIEISKGNEVSKKPTARIPVGR